MSEAPAAFLSDLVRRDPRLQLIAVPKAQIEKLLFWAFFDSRD
jgi:hypothetical protein